MSKHVVEPNVESAGPDWTALRVLRLEAGRIVIHDGCTPGRLQPLQPVNVSTGYGRRTNRPSYAETVRLRP